MGWGVAEMGDQAGRVAIVTGANSGIGFETAKALALHGAEVVMACRDPTKAEAARLRVEAHAPRGSVRIMTLDLASLGSVQRFAEAYLGAYDRLDLLINNAGVMVPPRGATAEGFELQFGVNHLGHFALTSLLVERLIATPGARIVSVSSIAHRMGRIDFGNLNAERGYHAWRAYGQSKLANLLFVWELARRLRASDTVVAAAHPGFTRSGLQRSSRISRLVMPCFAQGAAQGALPSLYAATAPGVRDRDYYGPRHLFETRGAPRRASRAAHAEDDAVAARLWEVSEQLTGARFP